MSEEAPRKRRIVRLAVAFGVLVAGILIWDAVKYEILPKRFAVVEEGFLYRSAQISPRLIEGVLVDNEIDRVVWLVGYDDTRPEHVAERETIDRLGLDLLNFAGLRGNGTGPVHEYVEAITAVARTKQAGERVLVHCAAGTRRTAGVIALYMVLVEGRSTEEAYGQLDFVWGARPAVESPILAYLNENMGAVAEGLVETGVIERVPDPLPVFVPPS